jgi:hypothetical protein
MSIERTLRRITKQLAKQGIINAENERTMVMVSVGAKGYENKWPCRPFHQKPGSMRRKKLIRNFLHGQGETTVSVFTGVTPVSAGPMFISANGVDQEVNFDFATAVIKQNTTLANAIAAIQQGVKDLHEAGAITNKDLGNMATTLQGSVSDYKSTPGEAKYAENFAEPTKPFPRFSDHLTIARGISDLQAESDSPLETFIAVDPGTPGYPDRAVAAQFTRDPVTDQVSLVSTSIVAPPSSYSEGGPEFIYMPEVDGGQSVTKFMNTWIKQAEASAQEPAPAMGRSYAEVVEAAPDVTHVPQFNSLTEVMAQRGSMLADFKKQYKQASEDLTTVDGKPDQVHVAPSDPMEHRKAQILAEADQTLQGLLVGLNLVTISIDDELPEVGDSTKSYYLAELGALFRWDTDRYVIIEHKGVECAKEVKQQLETASNNGVGWARRLWSKLTDKLRK